jgi:hypothetical protein
LAPFAVGLAVCAVHVENIVSGNQEASLRRYSVFGFVTCLMRFLAESRRFSRLEVFEIIVNRKHWFLGYFCWNVADQFLESHK